MRLIDPTKTRHRVLDTEYGKRMIRYTDHFNGSRDVDVKVKGLRMNFTQGAPPDENLIRAIGELESANREWRLAKHSKSDDWRAYAKRRLTDANVRVTEVQ